MATQENSNPNSILLENKLIDNILSRLPVKTLLRGRSVCKSWLSLISSPDFNKAYYTRFTHHRLIISEMSCIPHIYRPLCEIEGLIEEPESCSLYSLLNESVTETLELDYPILMKNIDHLTTYVVGSCNGLICLACFDGRAFLWNPSTGKSRTLPKHEYEHTVCGFGYDELKDDFKVFAFFGPHREYNVSVYSLKSDCWRMIENLTLEHVFLYMGELAHGALHWVVMQESDKFIVSIDIKTEMYREIMLPKYEEDLDSFTLHTLEGNLCVVCYIGKTHAEFWMMNEYGVEESWTKLFTQSYKDEELPYNPQLIPICFFLNGDVMMFVDTAIVRYKPKDDTFEVLLRTNNQVEAQLNIYAESLISPCVKEDPS